MSAEKPFIICEAGVNWRDLVDADQMIKAAAEAGADAVKFQCYKPLFGINKDSVILGRYHPRAEELNRISLDESTIRYLYWRCQQHGIEFMCTPFYVDAVDMIDPFVKRWKIRHADQHNLPLINKIAETGKPVLISTSDGPFKGNNPGISYLLCQPEYPPRESVPIAHTKGYEGVSSHIPCWRYPERFKETGCKYLEVHVRLDHYEPPHYCPIDTAVSITMSELAELCRRL